MSLPSAFQTISAELLGAACGGGDAQIAALEARAAELGIETSPCPGRCIAGVGTHEQINQWRRDMSAQHGWPTFTAEGPVKGQPKWALVGRWRG